MQGLRTRSIVSSDDPEDVAVKKPSLFNKVKSFFEDL
jgi:hypothetical protein